MDETYYKKYNIQKSETRLWIEVKAYFSESWQ